MSWQRILVRHNVHWDRSEYVNGDEVLLYMSAEQICRSNLIHQIKDVVGGMTSDYLLFYTTRASDGRRVKVALQNDTDLLRLLVEQKEEPVVYVIEKGKQSETVADHIDDDMYCAQRSIVSPRATKADDHVDQGHPQKETSDSSDSESLEDSQHKQLFESLIMEFSAWIRKPGHLDKFIGLRNFSSDQQGEYGTNDGDDDEARSQVRNWVIPLLEFDIVLPLGWIESAPVEAGQLYKGATFGKKDDLAIAVGLYNMENFLEYTVDRSTTARLGFVCKHSTKCSFKVRATQECSVWRLIKCSLTHTCHTELNRTAPRQFPSKVVATYFKRKLQVEGVVLKPREMIAEMRRLFGVEMDYSFALRSRNMAIEMTYGQFDDSYQRLPSFLHLLRARNPGTSYDIHTTHTGEFRHIFLALGQSIHAFEHFLRPVIVVDGTHLKGKNKGVLFIVATKDGNEGIFPLVVGIGPIENDESWTWFMSRVRHCFGQPDELLIVSDQHVSIRAAIDTVYPNVAHGLCYYHIQKNLTSFGAHVAAIFRDAAYSYSDEVFRKNYSSLEAMGSQGAYIRLSNIGVERWARSRCPVRRTSFMTSNPAESMNSRLLWARRLPICALLENYCSIMEKWFNERRARAESRNQELTEEALKKLSVANELGRRYVVRATTTNLWKVEGENGDYTVDLQNWTCDCREFDLDMIPCRHATAAIRHAGLSVYDFVGRYFKQEFYRDTYALIIEPVPHPDSWVVPAAIASYIVRPPIIHRQAGRSRMRRARSAVESLSSTRRQVCSRCKAEGHNIRACTEHIPVDGVDLNDPVLDSEGQSSTSARRRQKKKCSLCRSADHTKRKCPLRVPE